MLAKILTNKRLSLSLLLVVIIAVFFWSQSRIPALNEKAQMGLRTNFNAIAFDVLLPVSDDQPVVERVAKTSVNWAYTNWKGMTFGLLFAAAVLTILGNVANRQFKRPWMNTFSGVVTGAPLGVCINCATPIAYGIYSAGARLETALAALISSPTLNAIVLTMTFTLLPWEMAFGKLIGVLVLLSAVPLLVRRFADAPNLQGVAALAENSAAVKAAPLGTVVNNRESEGYPAALRVTITDFARNLLYIIRVALPLMLLAGVLGALVIELVPFSLVADAQPGFIVLMVTALIATILPVPIAFDVIIAMTLLASGIDPGIVAVLLFSLGIYSIYPALVIARNISVSLSVAIAAAVIALACAIGVVTDNYFVHKAESEKQLIAEGLAKSNMAAYSKAVGVCGKLPEKLRLQCFAEHIKDFGKLVPYTAMCTENLIGVDSAGCRSAVDNFLVLKKAGEQSSTEICSELASPALKSQCAVSVVLQSARENHDIEICRRLPDDNLIRACRTQYINSNLLFNLDDAVCNSLQGRELTSCQINLAIYRFADVRDFDGCAELPDGAQDHCRYVIASSMVGRGNDPSGCDEIASAPLQRRCESQVTVWRAIRESSFESCTELANSELGSICYLRVADQKIQTVLARHMLGITAENPLADNLGYRTDNKTQEIFPDALESRWKTVFEGNQIEIAAASYRSSEASPEPLNRFKRVAAADLGIVKSWDFKLTDFFEPFIMGKGIASGDFNGDLWPDIALASEQGVFIYQNVGGRFQLIPVEQRALANANVFLVAFVDANGDGAQDLFASAYGGKNYLLINRDGEFKETRLLRLDGDHRLTMSAGFADLDQNGEIDMVLGNWSSGTEKLFAPSFSENRILFQHDGSYLPRALGGAKGETLSVLLADITGDHITDIVIANDRTVPDMYFVGAGEGIFQQSLREGGMIPVMPMNTMSLDAADFDNDLDSDLFAVDMTFASSSRDNYCEALEDKDARIRCEQILDIYQSFQDGDALACADEGQWHQKQQCFMAFSIRAAKALKDTSYCDNLPGRDSAAYSLCLFLASPVPAEQPIDLNLHAPQVQRNILLLNEGKHFVETGREFGVDSSFWSWNAKAADLDNDEWMDMYVGNGFHFGESFYEIQDNRLFRNLGGTGFVELAADWGLDDPINTPSYTYLDLDLDGDLDIIATGVLSPPRVYINELSDNNSVTFVLNDVRGNSSAIGAKVTIEYGGGRSQRKENKLSGGFLSFDNPVLHFGLGQYDSIEQLTIHWPDGTINSYDVTLAANAFYRIRRK